MNNPLREAIQFALFTGVGVGLYSPLAFGQIAANQPTPSQSQSTSQPTALGTIKVTGTRIPRSSIETAQPITIVTQKQIRESGLTTIGQVLQNLTQAGIGQGPLLNNGGNGSQTIDLRYFGPNRVLVLVNGRRWTVGLDGTVDLNNIPAAVVDHIEILQDGASAIYGSDAITGVVNIITVKNFNGAEAHAHMGIYHNTYDGFDHWDGKTQSYNFTVGSSGPRSAVVASASYTEWDAVMTGARAQSKEPVWTQGVANGAGWTPAGQFIILGGQAYADKKIGQAVCNSSGSCAMTLINTPTNTPTLANFRDFQTPGDLFNNAPANYLLTPLETKSLYLQGHFDIADNVTYTFMGETNVRDSGILLPAQPLGFGASGNSTIGINGFGIGANNPYNPFQKDLVSASSQFCPSGLTAGGKPCSRNLLLSFLGRQPLEGPPRARSTTVTSYNYRMGLNGFFDAIGSEWDWDVGATYGNVFSSTLSGGEYDYEHVAEALDAPGYGQCNGPGQTTSPSSGNSVQVGGLYYPIIIPGCVPMNVFGGYNQQTQGGSITPEMLQWVLATSHDTSSDTLRDYEANITGNLFQLPAGPIAVALGAEYLEENGFDTPDPLDVLTGQSVNTAGRQWTHAEYFELNVPILSDLPLAKSLSVDVANRWSQFSWTGGVPPNGAATTTLLPIEPGFGVMHAANATTGEAKLRWQPTEDLLLRGSWSQGFRVPSISDLYSGIAINSPPVRDPCAPNTQNGSWNPASPLPAGCQGIVHIQTGSQISTISGSNPSMTPEHSISRSAGFVYSPGWLAGFSTNADYYKIELDNMVGSLGPQFIVDACYIENNPQYCSRVHVVGGGRIIQNINNTNTNVGTDYSRGVDFGAHYSFPSSPLGNFTIGTNWTFVQSFVSVVASSTSPTGFQKSELVGFATTSGDGAIPQRKGNLTVNWNYSDWSAHWFVQYIGKVYESCSGITLAMNECSDPNGIYTADQENTQGKNLIGTTIYNDVQVTYHVEPISTDFTFGVRNLFNKQPPAALTAFANSFLPQGGYRLPGRFFYANIGVKF